MTFLLMASLLTHRFIRFASSNFDLTQKGTIEVIRNFIWKAVLQLDGLPDDVSGIRKALEHGPVIRALLLDASSVP